jgi:hypothetical protein
MPGSLRRDKEKDYHCQKEMEGNKPKSVRVIFNEHIPSG